MSNCQRFLCNKWSYDSYNIIKQKQNVGNALIPTAAKWSG